MEPLNATLKASAVFSSNTQVSVVHNLNADLFSDERYQSAILYLIVETISEIVVSSNKRDLNRNAEAAWRLHYLADVNWAQSADSASLFEAYTQSNLQLIDCKTHSQYAPRIDVELQGELKHFSCRRGNLGMFNNKVKRANIKAAWAIAYSLMSFVHEHCPEAHERLKHFSSLENESLERSLRSRAIDAGPGSGLYELMGPELMIFYYRDLERWETSKRIETQRRTSMHNFLFWEKKMKQYLLDEGYPHCPATETLAMALNLLAEPTVVYSRGKGLEDENKKQFRHNQLLRLIKPLLKRNYSTDLSAIMRGQITPEKQFRLSCGKEFSVFCEEYLVLLEAMISDPSGGGPLDRNKFFGIHEA